MSREPQRTENEPLAPWLTIVGIGADGIDSLAPRARRALEEAELVFGSARQLALVEAIVRGERAVWPSPLARGIERLVARRGRPTCVLASGDPFHFGIGATLAREIAPAEMICHPAPSSLSLAAARLGWALQDTRIVSLHGRELCAIVPSLAPGRRVLALSWDRTTPALLAALLCERGFGASRLVVLESLGGRDERVRECTAASFALDDLVDLNLVALELRASPSARVARSFGLPDEAFEHDGQLTKRDVRAVTLAALSPHYGERLWDVGAGSGSIAIEWMLADPSCRAVAVEANEQRCARIVRNARALGVPGLEVVHARAPAGLEALPEPDAIFIGGGGSDGLLVARCMTRLKRGGRLVINAVSLETEAQLIALHAAHGGELVRLSVEQAKPLGTMTGWRAAMPIVQWRYQQREADS